MIPVSAAVIGPPGLAHDVVRQLLTDAGVGVVDDPGGGSPAATVVVLVEPLAEHWSKVRGVEAPVLLVLAQPPDDGSIVAAVLAGADAVLSFDSGPIEIVGVLEAVHRGESFFTPTQVRAIIAAARTSAHQERVVLSRRESEILQSIARGESVKGTAAGLGIAPKTVENLQGRLFRKLGARNRAQAVARAHELGLM